MTKQLARPEKLIRHQGITIVLRGENSIVVMLDLSGMGGGGGVFTPRQNFAFAVIVFKSKRNLI